MSLDLGGLDASVTTMLGKLNQELLVMNERLTFKHDVEKQTAAMWRLAMAWIGKVIPYLRTSPDPRHRALLVAAEGWLSGLLTYVHPAEAAKHTDKIVTSYIQFLEHAHRLMLPAVPAAARNAVLVAWMEYVRRTFGVDPRIRESAKA